MYVCVCLYIYVYRLYIQYVLVENRVSVGNVIGTGGQYRRKILIKGSSLTRRGNFRNSSQRARRIAFPSFVSMTNFTVSTGYSDRGLCEASATRPARAKRYVEVDIFTNARHFNPPRGENSADKQFFRREEFQPDYTFMRLKFIYLNLQQFTSLNKEYTPSFGESCHLKYGNSS